MANIQTNPNPLVANQPATLTYSKYDVISISNNIYVLRENGNPVSDTFTGPLVPQTIISPNVTSTAASTSSSSVYINGIVYTSMENSPVTGNGYIQQLDLLNNSVSVYFQFNNTASPPVPSSYNSPQYPTGLSRDSYDNLYFLVFGDNNIYKITDLTNPYSNYVKFNTNVSSLSAPFAMTTDFTTNYLYITATQAPYDIGQIDNDGIETLISNYTAGIPSYGICCDNNRNLYIGYDNGVIGKYSLTTNTYTANFLTLTDTGTVFGLTYFGLKNVIIANVGSNGNIYGIPILNPSLYSSLINNSGLLGNFTSNFTNTIYGTSNTNMISYTVNNLFTFNNLLLTNGSHTLELYNQTKSSQIDTFTIEAFININPTTNYTTFNQNTNMIQDLSGIFQPLSFGSSIGYDTGFKVSNQDFSNLFASISSGSSIGYNTGYRFNGDDLSTIFAKYEPEIFTATGSYISTYVNNYYIITFTNSNEYNQINSSASITFYLPINSVNILVVGGGGGGGNNYGATSSGGGGGAGGNILNQTINISVGTYPIQVGYGGNGAIYSSGLSTGNTGGQSYFNSYISNGGIGGQSSGSGGSGATGTNGGGSGGNGGIYSSSTHSGNGSNGTQLSIAGTNYYFSGGGSGGSYLLEAGGVLGGLGGGGGAAYGTGANGGVAYNGPNGIYYPVAYTFNGYISTGGGGPGANGPAESRNGGNGGSGIVVIWFQWP